MAQAKQYGHKARKNEKSPLRWVALIGTILWALAVLMWVLSEVAGLYGNHPSLGTPIKAGQFLLYPPWAALGWPETIWSTPQVQALLDKALMIFPVPPLLIFLAWIISGQQKGIDDLHGSAHWATRKEIEEMGYFGGKGVYVGGWWDNKKKIQYYLRHNGPEHILCFAPTRSGKGVGLILPTLLAWDHSTVVLDIKGENCALTSGHLKSLGHTILRFDPSDHTGASARFNPLDEVRLDSEKAISDIQQIATMVLDPEGKGLTDYWNKAAFGFLGGVLLHCMLVTQAKHQRAASLYDVSVMLEDPEREGGPKELFEEIIKTDHAKLLLEIHPDIDPSLGEPTHVFCASAARGMLAKADKEMAGVVSTATSNLGLYRDPVVARNIACSDFRIADLMNRDKPVNLYMVISPANIDRMRALLRIIVTQLLGRLTEKMEFGGGGTKTSYKHRLLLMLDEFTSLGKLAKVEQAIAYMAGYGVKGYFIVQDTKQLNAAYGKDNALMGNCHVRIAYAPNDIETAEVLSKMTGTTTVISKKASISLGKGGRSRSTSISEHARPLLTPDECTRLPGIRKSPVDGTIESGDMLIFTAGNSPIYGRQILHFIDPVFSARSKMPCPPVSDSFYFQITPAVKTSPAPIPEQATDQQREADDYTRYLDDLPEAMAA